MSNKIVFFADACCDMPLDFAKKNGVSVIGLRYTMGKQDGWYTGATQKEIDGLYAKMRKGEFGSTSLVLYNDAIEAFEPHFKDGADIIHVGLSSGLAKTWENANKAGNDLAKKYGRKFYAPDTKTVSGANWFILKHAIELAKKYEGDKNCFDKIVRETEVFAKKVRAFFTVESLAYLHKSGRLGTAQKIIGGMLKIKPIITVDANGKLVNHCKKTGRLASIQYLASQIANADPAFSYAAIAHADSEGDAKILAQRVKEIKPDISIDVVNIGFIIGIHTGPGTLGLCFVQKD